MDLSLKKGGGGGGLIWEKWTSFTIPLGPISFWPKRPPSGHGPVNEEDDKALIVDNQ